MKKKKSTTKSKISRTGKGKNPFEVTVSRDFDLKNYATDELAGTMCIEGYTFIIEECNIVLPVEHNVKFSKCKFLSAGSIGGIYVAQTAEFVDCNFEQQNSTYCTLKICLMESAMHICINGCTGTHVGIYGMFPENDASVFCFNCRIKFLYIANSAQISIRDITGCRIGIRSAKNIEISRSTLTQDISWCHSSLIDIESIQRHSIQILGCNIQGSMRISYSSILALIFAETRLERMTLMNCTLVCLTSDCISEIGLIDARTSACDSSLSWKSANTLTSSLNSAGFPKVESTLYKKVRLYRFLKSDYEDVVIEMKVPPYAEARFTEYSRKIRVSEATPVRVFTIIRDEHGTPETIKPMGRLPFLSKLASKMEKKFRYRLGKPARPTRPFDLSSVECSSGIHGFINPMEAANY